MGQFGMTVFTPISGMMADKLGARTPTVVSMSVASIGCVLLACAGSIGTYLFLITGLLCIGVGMGMFTPPNNISVMGSAPSDRLGVAGGILNMARTFGMGFGVTFGGLFYQIFFSLYHHINKPEMQAKLSAYHDAYLMVLLLGIISLIISLRRARSDRIHQDFFIGSD